MADVPEPLDACARASEPDVPSEQAHHLDPVGELAALLAEVAADPRVAAEVQARIDELVDVLPPAVRDALAGSRHRQGEAVLSYAGKRTRGEILGDARVAPLQTIRRFGVADGEPDWVNKLIFGDNAAVLRRLVELKRAGKLVNADGSSGVRVCYIDPPFATNREFARGDGEVAYADCVDGADFVEFLRERFVLIHELLADDGTLWVHLDSKKVHYAKVALGEIFGEGSFQADVIWKRQSAKNDKGLRQPGRIHDTLLMYTKSAAKWVWNKQYLPLDPAEVARSYTYDDGDGRGKYRLQHQKNPQPNGYRYEYRGIKPPVQGWRRPLDSMKRLDAEGRLYIPAEVTSRTLIYEKKYLAEADGMQLQSLWLDISPMKKAGLYPTQKPDALLERVIRASSNPGDLVLDCFAGSGSTLRAAERLSRRWIGVDVGKLAIHTATRDLLKVEREDGSPRAPFDLVHGGLYDEERLLAQPFADWRSFVLALYQCRDDAHDVGGVHCDGRRGPRGAEHVIVYDWETTPDRVVDEQYLRSLHAALRPALSRGRVSVIIPQHLAPTLVVDSYRKGQLEVRILRVPPSLTALVADGGAEGFAELSRRRVPGWSWRGVTLDSAALRGPVALTWIDRFGNELREVIDPSEWTTRKATTR